jgi:small-conductance mechanosensitive channel
MTNHQKAIEQELEKQGIQPTPDAIAEILRNGGTPKAIELYVQARASSDNYPANNNDSAPTQSKVDQQQQRQQSTTEATEQAYRKMSQLRADQATADAIADARRDAAQYLNAYQQEFLKTKATGMLHILGFNSQVGDNANEAIDPDSFFNSLGGSGLEEVLAELDSATVNSRQVEETAKLNPEQKMKLLTSSKEGDS